MCVCRVRVDYVRMCRQFKLARVDGCVGSIVGSVYSSRVSYLWCVRNTRLRARMRVCSSIHPPTNACTHPCVPMKMDLAPPELPEMMSPMSSPNCEVLTRPYSRPLMRKYFSIAHLVIHLFTPLNTQARASHLRQSFRSRFWSSDGSVKSPESPTRRHRHSHTYGGLNVVLLVHGLCACTCVLVWPIQPARVFIPWV